MVPNVSVCWLFLQDFGMIQIMPFNQFRIWELYIEFISHDFPRNPPKMPVKFRNSIRNHSFLLHLHFPITSFDSRLEKISSLRSEVEDPENFTIYRIKHLQVQTQQLGDNKNWRYQDEGNYWQLHHSFAQMTNHHTFSCYKMTVMHLFVRCLRGTFMANPVHSALFGLVIIYPPWK